MTTQISATLAEMATRRIAAGGAGTIEPWITIPPPTVVSGMVCFKRVGETSGGGFGRRHQPP